MEALNQSRAQEAEREDFSLANTIYTDTVLNYHTSNPLGPTWEGIEGVNLHACTCQKAFPNKLKGKGKYSQILRGRQS